MRSGPDRCDRAAAEGLYWAILDPRTLGRERIRRSECGFLFEESLPCQLEEIQTGCAWAPDGRVLVCGAERSVVEEALAAGAVSLVPDRIPDWIEQSMRDHVRPESLELLTREYEPRPVRRARVGFGVLVACLLAAGCFLAAWGVVARAASLARAAEDVDARRADIVRAAVSGSGATERLPPELRLAAELRELERTRAVELPATADAAPVLAALLALWPEGLDLRPDSILVDGRSVVVRGRARDAVAMQTLADALGRLDGWRLAPPEFRAATEGVDFTISLARASTNASSESAGGGAGAGVGR